MFLQAVQEAKKKRSARSRTESRKHTATGIAPMVPTTSRLPIARQGNQRLAPAPANSEDVFAGSPRRNAAAKRGAPTATVTAAAPLTVPALEAADQRELTTPAASAGNPALATGVPQGSAGEPADAAEVAAAVKHIVGSGGGDLDALLAYVRSGRL
jgi:hypothetical protein